MNTSRKFLIGIGAVATSIVGYAVATPIINLASPILSAGVVATDVDAHGEKHLPDGSDFKVSLRTTGPASILTQVASYGVAGINGWHAHAGMVAVTIISGTIEWFDENCVKTTYTAGDSWIEGSSSHYFRNVGTANVQLTATFIIAKGEPLRIDKPAPACAAALGLT